MSAGYPGRLEKGRESSDEYRSAGPAAARCRAGSAFAGDRRAGGDEEELQDVLLRRAASPRPLLQGRAQAEGTGPRQARWPAPPGNPPRSGVDHRRGAGASRGAGGGLEPPRLLRRGRHHGHRGGGDVLRHGDRLAGPAAGRSARGTPGGAPRVPPRQRSGHPLLVPKQRWQTSSAPPALFAGVRFL